MKRLLAATALAALFATSALADTTLKLVEVITSPQRTETLKGIVGQFEAANPGTTVEIIGRPGARHSRSSPPWSRRASCPT